ncbi:MAG: DUF2877 domain-containing protein [Candidatus Rokuibacteriota bacterium]
MAQVPLPVVTIGWRAQAALAGQGAVRPLGARSESAYLTVDGELVWLGRVGAGLHARAVLVPRVPDELDGLALDQSRACVWRPLPPSVDAVERSLLATGCHALRRALPVFRAAAGFGALLVGQPLGFPLEGATEAAHALARACAENDPSAAVASAERLIGLGPGLTPAGDDFVGGAFFARAALAGATSTAGGWAQATAGVRAIAAARTHPISAVLLSDLLAGEGHEPLHDLAAALAAGAMPMAVDAAGRLARIGHSSGWDLLAGFIAGVLGPPALAGTAAAARSTREGWV